MRGDGCVNEMGEILSQRMYQIPAMWTVDIL